MSRNLDLVIRNGLVVDGTGAQPYPADIAVRNGIIAQVGPVPEHGAEEIDATDCIVTPGFVDIHTHYDGQAIWSDHLSPSSQNGVTTAVMGNCGVGFAPCAPTDHDLLVNAMEGVEDIPEAVMSEGLPWNWETFADYLQALDSRPRDINVAQFLPHSPLRVYAMGNRGARREPASPADIARMAGLAREAMAAGAIGFSTSRTAVHRRGDGELIPSFDADEAELQAIAGEIGNRGVVQIVTSINDAGQTAASVTAEIELLARLSKNNHVTVTFAISQASRSPDTFTRVMGQVARLNRLPGVALRPQFAPRPIGVYLGFNLSANPFSACPTYQRLADLPLAARLRELRKPEVRKRITDEPPSGQVLPIVLLARQFERLFAISDPPCYEPAPETSIAARAAQAGKPAAEVAYDALLEDDGRAMLYVAMSNYAFGNLDHLTGMFEQPEAVIGLGDGGAHYGMVCDATYPTFMLTHWTRQRDSRRLTMPDVVRMLTSVPAGLVSLKDRGTIRPNYQADLNVIEYDSLRLHAPEVRKDLPAGGRRISQAATGYRCTIVAGTPIVRDDEFTGALPGRLIRGATAASG